jgi:hypothetical protein
MLDVAILLCSCTLQFEFRVSIALQCSFDETMYRTGSGLGGRQDTSSSNYCSSSSSSIRGTLNAPFLSAVARCVHQADASIV